jgi:hypothetical protein
LPRSTQTQARATRGRLDIVRQYQSIHRRGDCGPSSTRDRLPANWPNWLTSCRPRPEWSWTTFYPDTLSSLSCCLSLPSSLTSRGISLVDEYARIAFHESAYSRSSNKSIYAFSGSCCEGRESVEGVAGSDPVIRLFEFSTRLAIWQFFITRQINSPREKNKRHWSRGY